jgi:hypothetical protein
MRQPSTKRRFRPVLMLFLLGVVAFIMYYMQCGSGFGLGPGDGTGDGARERVDRGEQEQEPSDVRPALGEGARRCRLRLDRSGLTLDGQTTTVTKAVSACKKAGGAELTPTGDAVYGQLQEVRQALDRAGVEVFERSPATVPER